MIKKTETIRSEAGVWYQRICLLFLIWATLFFGIGILHAQEYRLLQGVISQKSSYHILVNESAKVFLSEETRVMNMNDKEISANVLKAGRWVYVEGPLNRDSSISAETIYLIPGNIEKKDRVKYPFIKIPY